MHKNFGNLKETRLFSSARSLFLYERLVRDEKLREVLVSSFIPVDNYAVAKEILVSRYCTKTS